MLRSCLIALLVLSTAVPAVAFDDQDGDEGITLNVRNEPLSNVLELLSVSERVNIVAGVDTNSSVTANFYDATLEEALDWCLTPLGYGWTFDGKVYMIFSIDDLDLLERPLTEHIFRPNYRTARELEAFMLPMLSANGRIVISEQSGVGIPSGGDEAGGDNSTGQETLLIIDNQDVVDTMIRLVADFDVMPRQVLVEATILEVTLDETNKWGVDFNLLANAQFSNFSSLDATKDVFSGTSLAPSTTYTGSQSGFTDPTSDGLRIGYIGSKVSIFIEALQSIVDTNVLANTKVLALNKQRAEIIIGGRLGYFGGTTVSDGISQQTVEFLETGTQLRFRPFIGDDGFVRLEIHPERSDGKVDVNTGLPSETTAEVTTNVMVRDGETVVIGGLIETSDVNTTSRVPILGYLPGLEYLFKSEKTAVLRREIVIVLTPHILEHGRMHSNSNGQTGAEIVDEHERDQAEFRETFGPLSRTVYATNLMRDAVTALAAGQAGEARLLADRAMILDPLHEGLIELSMEIDAAIDARDAMNGGR